MSFGCQNSDSVLRASCDAGVFTFTTVTYWSFLMPKYSLRVLVMGWGRSRDRYIKGYWTWEICLRHHESILSRSRTGNGRCEDGWEEGIHDGNPRCYLCHILNKIPNRLTCPHDSKILSQFSVTSHLHAVSLILLVPSQYGLFLIHTVSSLFIE